MIVEKQRHKSDCMLACVAMAVGRPYEELWPEEFQQEVAEAGCNDKRDERALGIAGLTKDVDYRAVCLQVTANEFRLRQMLWGRRAILQVPSLNYERGQHAVYWDGATLHDPSNLQVYRWLDHCGTINWVWIFNERTS